MFKVIKFIISYFCDIPDEELDKYFMDFVKRNITETPSIRDFNKTGGPLILVLSTEIW